MSKINDGTVKWQNVCVYDYRSSVENMEGFNDSDPIYLKDRSWMIHHVTGRTYTIFHTWKMNRENKKNKSKK